MKRRAYLDVGIGETRGAVFLDGRPERLLIERDTDIACQRLGARSVARIRTVDRGLGLAFLALPEGPDATTPIQRLAEGQIVEVEIAAEARDDKGPTVSVLGAGEGAPRLLKPGPGVKDWLDVWAEAALLHDETAREAVDLAEAAALETLHPLPGGGRLSVEPTRALVAVDVDLAGRKGGDGARLASQANQEAIATAARLLRLKALGGLVVMDLVGKGHNGPVLAETAKQAFAADEPGVSIGPISRFGLFEMALPHRWRPLGQILLDEVGAPTPLTNALRLLRALEREGRADPGGQLTAVCSPATAKAVAPYLPTLIGRLGARIVIAAELRMAPDRFEIASS